MLTKKQMDMYADVLLWGLKKARTETFEKGDVVMVQFDLPAVELAELLHGKAAGHGGSSGDALGQNNRHGTRFL